MTRVDRALVALIVTSLAGVDARAQSAGAEALFREGRTLIKQGKLEAGCDKLAASVKLESSVGTLLNLGDCREKLGRPASAWAAFRKAEDMAKRAGNDNKRAQEAHRRALKLEPELANVTVQVGPKSRGAGLTIKRDGEVVDPELWGTAIVVDPGNHTIVAEAPGKKPWQSELSVGKGGKRWVVVRTLEPVDAPRPTIPGVGVNPPPSISGPLVVAPPPPPPPPATTVITTPAPRTATVMHTRTWSTTRELAIGLGIAGAGALGAGVYFGSRAKDLENQSDAICPTQECADPEGLRLNARAQDSALRANVFFVGGGLAVAAATVMWFIGEPASETVVVPVVGDNHVGATLTRRF